MLNNTIRSYEAAGTITEYALVSVNAAAKIVVTTDPTDINCIGVAQRGGSSGDMVDVVIHGLTRAIAGDALNFLSTPVLAATTAGKLQAAEATDTTFFPVARVLGNLSQVSAADGEQVEIFFFGVNKLA